MEVSVTDALVDGFDQEIYEEPFIIYGLSPKQIVEKIKKFNPMLLVSLCYSL